MTVTRHDAIPERSHVTALEHLAWALAKTEAACDPTTPNGPDDGRCDIHETTRRGDLT